MEYVLQKESQEAKRKSIEAGGIASFQKIVSDGISPELLKWKGVEATEKFADSLNTKIIIMGNDGNSLPVILSAAEDDDDDNDHNKNSNTNTQRSTAATVDGSSYTSSSSSISASGNVRVHNDVSSDSDSDSDYDKR